MLQIWTRLKLVTYSVARVDRTDIDHSHILLQAGIEFTLFTDTAVSVEGTNTTLVYCFKCVQNFYFPYSEQTHVLVGELDYM